MDLFKKNIVVGVSVTPEIGLEAAQIDFVSKKVLKYGFRQLAYDNNRKEIADLDIFKEALQDLLTELQIPKGAEIVLNFPAITFKVKDYPASLNEEQILNAISEELLEHPIFGNEEPVVDAAQLPNSTIQFNKIAYTALQKTSLIEIAMQIKDLGYKLSVVDTSVNTTLNALIYKERVDVNPSSSWVLLLVDSGYCRIIPMQGRNYVDCVEEKISIGEVLGDAENYATVVGAVKPILRQFPSQYLCVVSKTNVISAEILAGQLEYNAPIIHQEANNYAKEPFLEVAPDIDENSANLISVDVIGAAINKEFSTFSNAHLNLFNSSLGDVYLLEQPPVVKFNSVSITLSLENMLKVIIVLAIIFAVVVGFVTAVLSNVIGKKHAQISELESKAANINKYLKENESVSAELFDEGDEIRMGLVRNKNIYTYYTIVGTEIPKKLWLTSLELGDNITIEGQADNLESIYSFFRNIKDYDPSSNVKLQKLGLASVSSNLQEIAMLDEESDNNKKENVSEVDSFDTDSIITSMTADYYQFRISDKPEVKKDNITNRKDTGDNVNGKAKKDKGSNSGLPNLEPLE